MTGSIRQLQTGSSRSSLTSILQAACTIWGSILKDKGDLEAAIDSYKQALKIKPDYAEAYSNMGSCPEG